MAGAKVVASAEAGWNLADPWRWMLVGVGASGLAFLQARFVGADWPALRGGLIVGGFVAWRSGEGMQAALPFGVFLGLAALAIIFFGPTLWSCYLALLPG